ncbi:tetratricopeptide repeat-containing sensor histidine kinase [Tenacibaculum adriaticum]|nr:tetratricopeptide repeat-containing sensor histidine kinase [Tenacibaculum adriaticum]
MAVIQRDAKDFLGSEISSIESLKYLKPIQAFNFLESVYNCLGLASEELNQINEAISYYKKAYKISKLNKDYKKQELGYIRVFNNLGLLYQKQKLHEKAIQFFKKGLKFDDIKEKYPKEYAFLLENLAASNFLSGNKKNVLKQYYEVLEIRSKLKDFKELSTININLSDYYKSFNQKEKALYHVNEALKYARQAHNNKRTLEALELLSELTTGKQSRQYLREYIQLNDSLFQQERRLKNQFAKIRYETDKKEKENVVLKTENEKKQIEIVRHKQQKTIGWLFAAACLFALALSVSFFVLRRRKQLYQAQLQRAEAREHERQQIAKSLHDEVAGDLRMLHQKLEKSQLIEEAQKLEMVKENVRNLSHQLSSVNFDKVSFKDQVINLVSDYFSLDLKIKVNGLQDYDWSAINNAIKRLLYLSIRESIQNSQKHAQATKIIIDLSIAKKFVFLSITDNGIGFDTKISKKGIGLHNLQERVEELNGTLTIESKVGEGTKTSIQIPINA